MTRKAIHVLARALASVATLVLLGPVGADAQATPGSTRELAATQRFQMGATVEAIDKAGRTLTVKGDGGRRITLDVPPEVRNFDQIEVGDRVRADYVDEVVIAVRKPGAPMTASDVKVVSVAPAGATPGAASIRTREVTATITAIDTERRLVTLRGPQGNSRTIHLDPDVRLDGLQVGEEVTARQTEATVLGVEKAAR
jgi:hypothetical protein